MESSTIHAGGCSRCDGVHGAPPSRTFDRDSDPVESFVIEAVDFAMLGLRERFAPRVIVDEFKGALDRAFHGPAITIAEGECLELPVYETWRIRLDHLGVDRRDPSQRERIVSAAVAAARRTVGLPE